MGYMLAAYIISRGNNVLSLQQFLFIKFLNYTYWKTHVSSQNMTCSEIFRCEVAKACHCWHYIIAPFTNLSKNIINSYATEKLI